MRYFIDLSFDGTAYHGWQVQPNGSSVQETLQRCLGLVLCGQKNGWPVVGAGRTDAGVHAKQMVAHFEYDKPFDHNQLVYRLNRILPRDISVQSIRPVADDLHARFSATRRTYRYFIHQTKSPFLRHYSWEVHYPLDFALMQQGAQMLLGERDFACFCKSGADNTTTMCRVMDAHFEQQGEQWVFIIAANRFLRNMVRATVGTLIELGRHRITLADLQQILDGGSRSDAGESVPGHALFLWSVEYGDS